MNSKNPGQIIAIAIAIVIAVWASVSILLNPTGGISGLSKLVTILGIVLGLMNPKAALYFLVVQAVYSDEIKRIGVFYGVQSTQTVSEILIGPLLTICAINISYFHGVIRRQFAFGGTGLLLYAITPTVAIIMLVKGRDVGMLQNVYTAGTTTLYLTLIPICYGIFRTFQDWVDCISWQAIVAAPAAAWGIWQYFNGFNNIEWSYALSGLSMVHTEQMMMREPRIFGLFGSASALSCVGIYSCFSLWRVLRVPKHRLLFLFLGVLYLTTVILSHQRTTLIYPIIVLFFAIAFRNLWSTILLYGSALSAFVLGVLNASYLLDKGIYQINELIRGDGKWAENVLMVSTFSDRLRGWERLGRADSWSLFGTGKELRSDFLSNSPDYTASDYSHDIINRIVINFGAVGLFATLLVGGCVLFSLHRVVYKSTEIRTRKDGAFIMACIVPGILLAFIAGGNFSATPVNLQMWTVLSGIFVLKKLSEGQRSINRVPVAKPSPLPESRSPAFAGR
jgi:hypothetical protein